MSEVEVMQNERIFPVFYKKKVLSLEKTKELQEMAKELLQENEQIIADESLMLEKIRIKHMEFITRLEAHLERFKNSNAEKILLVPDMLPVWSQDDASSSIIDDYTERLIDWYNTVATYVSLQRNGVNQIISDWFSQMDKIASEGENEPQGKECFNLVTSSVDSATFWESVFWYIIFIMFCVVNMIIFYKPEAINQCVEDGICKCFVQNMLKISAFLYNHYLKFHNITVDNPPMILENSTAYYTLLCSSKTEF